MRLPLLIAGLFLVLSLPADARMHAPYRGHRIVAGGAPPLDTFATPAGAYSFRRLKSTYSGPAIRIRRASDNAELDIGFLGFVSGLGSPIDVAAANAHCAATSCFLRTWYDQSGNARNLVQTTAASQPTLVFNCLGSLPCGRGTAAGVQVQTAASYNFATGVTSFGSVAKNDNIAPCTLIYAGTQQLASQPTKWYVYNGSVPLEVTPLVNNTWYAAAGSINGAASALTVNATTVTGTVTSTPGNTIIVTGFTGPTSCSHAEDIVWDGYALTAPERAALIANQRSFWGLP